MDSIFSNPVFYSLAFTLLHFLWQGCIVAVVLKMVLSFTSYKNPRLRYAWAMFAMMVNLCIPVATFYLVYTPDYTQLINTPFSLPIANETMAVIQAKEVLASVSLLEFLPYLSLSWLTIVLCLSAKLLIELYSVNRLTKTHVLPVNVELQQRFDELVSKIRLKSPPTLLISMKSQVPMVIGWLKPVVLLPAAMLSGLTPSQLDMLLLHELAHVRRHDYLINFVQTLVETLLFFHPAVRWVSKQMRNEREYCSDDIAVSVCKKPLAYAKALTETASVCHVHRRQHSIPSMAMAASGGDLKKRVIRLVSDQHHCASSENSGRWLASAFIVFAISIVLLKPLINLTVFDLTAGQFSLFRITSDTDYTQLASTTKPIELTQSSLVSYYLDDVPTTDTPSIVENTVDQAHAEHKLDNTEEGETNVTPELLQVAGSPVLKTTLKKEQAFRNVQQEYQNSLTKADTAKIEKVVAKQKSVTIEQQTKIAQFNVNEKASPVEEAFTRTDSSSKQSNSINPYAQTIADLAMSSPKNSTSEYDFAKFETSALNSKLTYSLPKAIKVNKPEKTSKINAVLVRSIEPRYPSSAKRKGIELDVLVEFTVDKYGKVSDVMFEQKSKVHFFRGAIKKAIEKWRFQPAKRNGRPIESKISKIFSFSLSE